jgi:hypothetical protein
MFGRLTRGFGSASKLAGAKDPSVDPLTGKKLSKRAVARLRGVYIPPSVEEAMENRDEEHPRVQGPRGPEPYPLSIGTGDLGVEMGPGIALYFNFLQWMAVMFFVLFLLNFPTILVANAAKYYGPFSASRNSTGYQAVWDGAVAGDFDFASTTFGSIAPDDVEEGDWLIYNGFKSWGFVVHVTKVHFLYGCAAMDLLGVFLFFVVMFFFRRRQKAIVKSVDEDSIEISDYSVTVKGLPEDATDKEEVRCFFELKFGKVVDAVLAKNDGVLLTLYRKRGALSMKYDETHSKYIRKGAKSAQKLMEKIQGKNRRHRQAHRQDQVQTQLQDEAGVRDVLGRGEHAGLPRSLSPHVARALDDAPRGEVQGHARVHRGGGAGADGCDVREPRRLAAVALLPQAGHRLGDARAPGAVFRRDHRHLRAEGASVNEHGDGPQGAGAGHRRRGRRRLRHDGVARGGRRNARRHHVARRLRRHDGVPAGVRARAGAVRERVLR